MALSTIFIRNDKKRDEIKKLLICRTYGHPYHKALILLRTLAVFIVQDSSCFDQLSLVMRKPFFAKAKTKAQISFAVTVKLVSAFVFAAQTV